jgi:hypothetical protein
VLRPLVVALAVALSIVSLHAQWTPQAPANAPRNSDGVIDFDAPPPRLIDGTPDLSGTWRGGGRDYVAGIRSADGTVIREGGPTGFSYPGRSVAYTAGVYVAPLFVFHRTAYGEEIYRARQATNSRDNPRGLCLPMGIVQLHTSAGVARYLQTARELVILYEMNGERREIFFDGRSLPANDPQPWWNGYSVGNWEGDVLVVETTHFRDGGWLDMAGNPLTDAGNVIERYRRPSYGRMEIDITIDDRKAYEAPFTVRWNQRLAADANLIESVCAENNRFSSRRR